MTPADVEKILHDLYQADTQKYFDQPAAVPLFDPPLIAVAAADDPWFAKFKELLGPWHWAPQESLALAAPGAVAQSVICFALPVAEVARAANRAERELPARSWAYVRTFGEEFLTRLQHGVEARLREMGHAAIAPAVAPQNKTEVRPGVGYASCWSERHAAFVAGLGTFGLSGAIITRRGIAHRLGSVVTDAVVPPTSRSYGDDPFAWCLKLARGTCGACITRCPVGSIGETVALRNKDACLQHGYIAVAKRGGDLYNWKGTYGCGLCQTAVPCEDRNPTETK